MIIGRSNTILGLLPALLIAPLVQADTTLTMKDLVGTQDALIEVRGHMVKMSQPGQPEYMLYDTRRNIGIHVSTADKEYMEIDQATIAGFADSVNAMKAQFAPQIQVMREQLKNLPPEQRAMLEKSMGGMVNLGAMESQPVENVTTVKRGSDKISGFTCDRYDVMSDKERVADMCLATEAGAGMSKDDFATLRKMMKFMREMASSAQKLSSDLGGPQIVMGDADGVPVAMKDFKYGHEYQVSGVSDASLDSARFSEYQAFARKTLPALR